MRGAKAEAGGEQVRDPRVGKIEKGLGSVVGCEGMVEEGGRSVEKK